MEQEARQLTLSNGLTVLFTDTARRYFGDYHQVRLEVQCEVALTPAMFEDEPSFRQAVAQIGKSVFYRRVEEQMGVPTAAVDACVGKLIESFKETALRYFDTAEFPRKLVHAELAKALRPRRPFMPMLSRG